MEKKKVLKVHLDEYAGNIRFRVFDTFTNTNIGKISLDNLEDFLTKQLVKGKYTAEKEGMDRLLTIKFK